MGPGSGSPPIEIMDVEVPKQYMISRIVRNSSRDMGKKIMRIKWDRHGLSDRAVGSNPTAPTLGYYFTLLVSLVLLRFLRIFSHWVF